MKNLWKFGLIVLIISAAMGCAHKKPPEPAPPEAVKLHEVIVKQVMLSSSGRRLAAPVIILANKENDKQVLLISVETSQGMSINTALEKRTSQRPGTHDLFADVLGQYNVKLIKVVITDLREDTYIATMKMESNDGIKEIDARPSDAIAIALRTAAPIFVSEEVIRKSGWLETPQQGKKPGKAKKKDTML